MGIQINGNTNNINAGIGSLSIEDLNELDIVGVATAANFKTGVSNLHNVGLTLSGGQIDVGSNIKIGTAGVITATSFVGSGANLTGITQTTINNNADNRVITGSGTANTLEGESTLTYNGGTFLQTKTGSNPTLTLSRNESVGDEVAIGTLNFANNTANTINARVAAYSDGTGNVGGHLYFETRDPSNSTLSERVRITSSGHVGIGTNAPVGGSYLHIHGAGASDKNHIRLTADRGLIARLGDTSGGAQAMFDLYGTDGSTQIVRFISGGGVNFINTGGNLGIGTDNPQRPLVISSSANTGAEFNIPDPNNGLSLNIYNRGTTAFHSLSFNAADVRLGINAIEKARLDNNGNWCVGITGGSAKLHTKGDQGGGLIKCDAAEGTTRFFLTGNDTSACELNMYNNAGTQATIIKAGASNNSTDIHNTQAGGRFRVYVTPNSGRTHQSSIFRPFQIDEYGELRQERGSEGWTSGYYETNNGGMKYHHRHAYTGASSQNVNLIRVRRHYWGAGFYKFIVRQTYYGGSYESHFWLNGHAANGNTTSFNLTHSSKNGGNSGWIQKTATSHSSPGNNYSGWTDVFVSIPAYNYFDIRVETSLMASHSYDINSMGNDAYALHPFS